MSVVVEEGDRVIRGHGVLHPAATLGAATGSVKAGGADLMLTLALERVEFLPLGRVTDDTSILTLRSLVFEPLCRWRGRARAPGAARRLAA